MKAPFSRKGPGILPCLLAALIAITPHLQAQLPDMAEARGLVATGHYAQAERTYSQLIEQNDEALLGRASVRSWQGNFSAAAEDYLRFLKKYPQREDAWVGYGYSLAWSGEYGKASRIFSKIGEQNPDNLDARKGLAYIQLWRGRGRHAVIAFQGLKQEYPDEAEYALALGQAYLLTGRQKAARQVFMEVPAKDPAFREARELLESVRLQPAYVEVEAWSGYSRLEQENKLGLRALSVAWQPRHDFRLWLRYDNSLSLDNLALVQNRQVAPTWYAGGLYGWSKRLATRFEAGRRLLPEQGTQVLFQGEQVLYLEKGFAMKVGASYGPVAGKGSDLLVYGGGRIPLTDFLALEPHYFYASSSLQQAIEHRALLNTQVQLPKGNRILAGLMVGKVRNENPDLSGTLGGGNLVWALPVVRLHELQFLTRYEKGVQESFFTLAAALKIRFER